MSQPIELHFKTIARCIAAAIVVLTCLHVFVMYCWVAGECGVGTAFAANFGYLFDLNAELNVPTWFVAALLFLVSALLWLTAQIERQRHDSALPWLGLSAIFCYLSLDEATDLHGLWAKLVPSGSVSMSHEGFLWVIPAIPVVGIVAILYARWIFRLPNHTRNYFLIAGFTYVAGGLGFEIIGSLLADETFLSIPYLAAATAEEFLEMSGVFIMLLGVVAHLMSLAAAFSISEDIVGPSFDGCGVVRARAIFGAPITQISAGRTG